MAMINLIRRFLKSIILKFPYAVNLYWYLRDNPFNLPKPENTSLGFKFSGNSAMVKGQFEPEETEIAKKIIDYSDVFINIGANIGYYCCIALRSGKYTIAFEPIPGNLRYLYNNIKANQYEKSIEVFPVALSDKVGILEMYGSGTGASLLRGWAGISDHHVSLVPALIMDDVMGLRFQNKKCFILADIEGAEMYMLQGALGMLRREIMPVWMVEISISEHQPAGVIINPNLFSTFALFWENGYEAWTADKLLRPIYSAEVESIVKSGKDTLLTHNFLFIESGKKNEIFVN